MHHENRLKKNRRNIKGKSNRLYQLHRTVGDKVNLPLIVSKHVLSFQILAVLSQETLITVPNGSTHRPQTVKPNHSHIMTNLCLHDPWEQIPGSHYRLRKLGSAYRWSLCRLDDPIGLLACRQQARQHNFRVLLIHLQEHSHSPL